MCCSGLLEGSSRLAAQHLDMLGGQLGVGDEGRHLEQVRPRDGDHVVVDVFLCKGDVQSMRRHRLHDDTL